MSVAPSLRGPTRKERRLPLAPMGDELCLRRRELQFSQGVLRSKCLQGGGLIRPYTKSELATMYFPIGSASNALRRLNRYINHAHGLLPALLATGYRVNDRHFTRRQVQLIFEYLGEP